MYRSGRLYALIGAVAFAVIGYGDCAQEVYSADSNGDAYEGDFWLRSRKDVLEDPDFWLRSRKSGLLPSDINDAYHALSAGKSKEPVRVYMYMELPEWPLDLLNAKPTKVQIRAPKGSEGARIRRSQPIAESNEESSYFSRTRKSQPKTERTPSNEDPSFWLRSRKDDFWLRSRRYASQKHIAQDWQGCSLAELNRLYEYPQLRMEPMPRQHVLYANKAIGRPEYARPAGHYRKESNGNSNNNAIIVDPVKLVRQS